MKIWRRLSRELRHISAEFYVSRSCVRLARLQAYRLNGTMAFSARVVLRDEDVCLIRVETPWGDHRMTIIVDGLPDMVDGTVRLKYHPEPDPRMLRFLGRPEYLRKPETYLTAVEHA